MYGIAESLRIGKQRLQVPSQRLGLCIYSDFDAYWRTRQWMKAETGSDAPELASVRAVAKPGLH